MAIGKEIRRQLDMRGYSIAWLAKASGIKATTLRSIISRDSWNIQADQIDKICNALEIEPATLLQTDKKDADDVMHAVKLMLDKRGVFIRRVSSLDNDRESSGENEDRLYEIMKGRDRIILSEEAIKTRFDEVSRYFEFSVWDLSEN